MIQVFNIFVLLVLYAGIVYFQLTFIEQDLCSLRRGSVFARFALSILHGVIGFYFFIGVVVLLSVIIHGDYRQGIGPLTNFVPAAGGLFGLIFPWLPIISQRATSVIMGWALAVMLCVAVWKLDAQQFAIVILCIFSAILYGILHDQVTARVCIEYFTIGHPAVFGTEDPTLLGIGWGIIATWWVGLLLGIPLAVAARSGDRPKLSARSLIRPIVALLLVMAGLALTAGLVGWALANGGIVCLVGPLAEMVPADRHVPFIADLWAHLTSYLVGFIGGIVVMAWAWRERGRVPTKAGG